MAERLTTRAVRVATDDLSGAWARSAIARTPRQRYLDHEADLAGSVVRALALVDLDRPE